MAASSIKKTLYSKNVTVHGQVSPTNLNNLKKRSEKGTDASERVPERDVSVPFLAEKSHEYPNNSTIDVP
jgi:hypothetical protein